VKGTLEVEVGYSNHLEVLVIQEALDELVRGLVPHEVKIIHMRLNGALQQKVAQRAGGRARALVIAALKPTAASRGVSRALKRDDARTPRPASPRCGRGSRAERGRRFVRTGQARPRLLECRRPLVAADLPCAPKQQQRRHYCDAACDDRRHYHVEDGRADFTAAQSALTTRCVAFPVLD
jgi:hypothetical protein